MLKKILSTLTLAVAALAFASPAAADNYLMYGPSLAVYIVDNDLCDDDDSRGCDTRDFHANIEAPGRGSDFDEDESHFATDAGHTVTIVSAEEWSAMTTLQFAAYDALVIGDAGCDFDDGGLLQPVTDNRAAWSPAVTGHLFLHTFDNVYHYNNNSPVEDRGDSTAEQFAGMVSLAVDGMEYAASSPGNTGFYYANGCRDLDSGDDDDSDSGSRGTEVTLEFLDALAAVTANTRSSGDVVEILETSHPSMVNLTDAALSDWGSSYHAVFLDYGGEFDLLAFGVDDEERGRPGDGGDVIIATVAPVGGGFANILAVPTAQPSTLILFALLLVGAGFLVFQRRF